MCSMCSMCCVGIRVLRDSVHKTTDWIERMLLAVCTSVIWTSLQMRRWNVVNSTPDTLSGSEEVYIRKMIKHLHFFSVHDV